MATGDRRLAMNEDDEPGFPWLETFFGISLLTLVCQLYPPLFWGILYYVDVRNWTWSAIWLINVLIIGVLLVIWKRTNG